MTKQYKYGRKKEQKVAGTLRSRGASVKSSKGSKGAADLTGILPDGCRIEVEAKKRFGGTQTAEQKKWQEFIESNNGIYILAHSADEFEELILPFCWNGNLQLEI